MGFLPDAWYGSGLTVVFPEFAITIRPSTANLVSFLRSHDFMIGTKLLAIVTSILLTLSMANFSCADETAQLRSAVSKLNLWLGQGSNAEGWRKFLNLNVLDSQAALGDQADTRTLRTLLVNFRKDTMGLRHPMFVEVARSIENQIVSIESTYVAKLIDLDSAVQQSLSQFRPPEQEEINVSRLIAIYELKMLKKLYRRTLPSRARAEIFHALKLDDSVEFLEKLKIEMPPEISVGKLRSMIRDEKEKRQEILDELDALPPEPIEEEDVPLEETELDLEPPGPDDGSDVDRAGLESQIEVFDERIAELQKRREQIQDVDGDRQELRDENRKELLRLKSRFRRLGQSVTDGVFEAANRAINQFANDYRYGTEDNIQEDFIRKSTELRELWPSLSDPGDSQSHAKLGSVLFWMENHQQLEVLCKSIRRKYSNPNAYVSVSPALIQSLTSRSSQEYDRIAEDFLGRFARGYSYSDTNINVLPVDNPHQAQLSIQLDGIATTDTYIREVGIRIDSTAAGTIGARRDLFAGLNGLVVNESDFSANIQAQFGRADTRFGFIQRIAQKQFQKQLSRTNAEATRKVRANLEERFGAETEVEIDAAKDQLDSLSRQLYALASRLPNLYLRSFADRVEVVAQNDSRLGLSAIEGPVIQFAGRDIQVKIHESLLNNFAGRRLTNRQLNAEISAIAGQDVEAFPTVDEEGNRVPPFRIRFARTRPVQITFSGNEIGITITGEEFQQGKEKIEDTLIIRWSFRVVQTGEGLVFQPQGYPAIDLPEDENPSARSIATATVFRKRIKATIDEVKEKQGGLEFKLPPRLIPEIDAMKELPIADQLQLGLFELRDGWAYVGWNFGGGVLNIPGVWTQMTVEGLDPTYTPMESGVSIESP